MTELTMKIIITLAEKISSMSIDLRELAKILELSTTTVSRALAKYPDVMQRLALEFVKQLKNLNTFPIQLHRDFKKV